MAKMLSTALLALALCRGAALEDETALLQSPYDDMVRQNLQPEVADRELKLQESSRATDLDEAESAAEAEARAGAKAQAQAKAKAKAEQKAKEHAAIESAKAEARRARARAQAKAKAQARANEPQLIQQFRNIVNDIKGRAPPKHVMQTRVQDWFKDVAEGVAEDAGYGSIAKNPEWLKVVKAAVGPALLSSTDFGRHRAKIAGFMQNFEPQTGMKLNDVLAQSLEDMAVKPVADSLSNSLGNQTMNVVRNLISKRLGQIKTSAEEAIANFSKTANLDDVRLFYDVTRGSVKSIKDIIRNITRGEDNAQIRKQDINELIDEIEARKVKPPMIDVVRNKVGEWTDKIDRSLRNLTNASVADAIRTELLKLDKSPKDHFRRGKIEIMTEAVGPKSLAQKLELPRDERRFGLSQEDEAEEEEEERTLELLGKTEASQSRAFEGAVADALRARNLDDLDIDEEMAAKAWRSKKEPQL